MSIESLLRDLRLAGRGLRRHPAFAAIAVLTLALGIGANTAMFSLVNGVLLRPLPYADADRLVAVWETGVRADSDLAKVFASYPDFVDWKRDARSFDAIAASTWAVPPRVLTGRGRARGVLVIPVSDSFFSLLGARPLQGRTFSSTDATAGCSVVLAHAFWREVLGGDTSVVGSRLTISDEACTVLGVMPPSFAFFPEATEVWRLLDTGMASPPSVGVFARLKPGVTQAQAEEELRALHGARHGSDEHAQWLRPVVYELQGEFTWMASRTLRTSLFVLLGAVMLVLIVASLNVAGLQVARSIAREQELAIRAALGSGRARLVRQLLTEAVLLAAAGAVTGLAVAALVLSAVDKTRPIELPVGADIAIDRSVLVFTMLVTAASALLVAVAPAWKLSRPNVGDMLKAGARGSSSPRRQRLGRLLLAGQTAVSATLLVAASLLMNSVLHMRGEQLGFRPENVFVSQVTLPPRAYANDEARIRFFEAALDGLSATPGVSSAAVASQVPPIVHGGLGALMIEGRDRPGRFDLDLRIVSPSYFETLGIPLLSGRIFDAGDRAGRQPVTIVNRALADLYFPGQNAIGKRVRAVLEQSDGAAWLTIVGIVGSEKATALVDERGWIEPPTLYWPLAQNGGRGALSIVLRGDMPGSIQAPALYRAIERVDATVPVSDIEPLETRVATSMAYPRFRAALLGGFAAFALALIVLGTGGLAGQFVAHRTRELGIRLAVGAHKRHLVAMVFKEGMVPIAIGLAAGLIGARAIGRYVESLLYGVSATDVSTVGLASIVVIGAAALSLLLPLRRAIGIEPVVVLRAE